MGILAKRCLILVCFFICLDGFELRQSNLRAATTFSAGSNARFDNLQPSLGLNYLIRISSDFDSLGEVGLFGSDSIVPAGWLPAAGQTLPIFTNEALFSQLGTTFGGDGQTSFRLPNLQGRTAIGAGQGVGLPNYPLGQYVGEERVCWSLRNVLKYRGTSAMIG